ncbi:MAG: glycosyltransferase [Gammaproteobacteria bacterium]|nr:glycosyltransferase [Gammaproteobacteria bacterium]NNF61978.1 glycosyltransferase [Gammaproteobacteria bacterium]
MRVLVGHNRYTQHGGEDAVFNAEVAMLESNGHEVIVFEKSNNQIASMSKASAAMSFVWSRESKRELQEVIGRRRPEIAHFHNTFPLISPSAYYACKEAGIPVVQTLHNYRLLCPAYTLVRNGEVCEICINKSFAWPAIRYRCYRGSAMQSAGVGAMLTIHRLMKTWSETVSAYIALTQFSRGKFIEGGFPAEKMHVKPNFMVPAQSSTPALHERNYLLFVGRLSHEKGTDVLLHALTRLRHIPVKIIGDGPLAEQLDSFIQDNGLTNVERIGQLPHDEVLPFVEAAACLVVPSRWYEGFPMTIVEAFSRAVPVIAARLGSLAEIVDDGTTGLHFDSGSSEDLARKLDWGWSNKEAMRAMGDNALREFRDNYLPQRNHEILMTIYKSAIGTGDPT